MKTYKHGRRQCGPAPVTYKLSEVLASYQAGFKGQNLILTEISAPNPEIADGVWNTLVPARAAALSQAYWPG